MDAQPEVPSVRLNARTEWPERVSNCRSFLQVRNIILVSETKAAQEPSNTRLILGNCIADVLMDASHNAKIYHWIVQRVGSAAIIQCGQEYTFEDAKMAAQQFLEELARQSQ